MCARRQRATCTTFAPRAGLDSRRASLAVVPSLNLTLPLVPFGPAGAFELTDEQVASLGGGKRAAVVVRVGDRTARVRLGVMGGRNVIGLSKANREALAVGLGDVVDVEISADTEVREVAVPDDLAAALASEPGLRDRFDALAYSHRKALVSAIEEAKQEATRARRVADTVAKVAQP